tara:strand:+ start:1033 stop:1506 length:474 start_codon:yes stop_codon:yes gene_type:complete
MEAKYLGGKLKESKMKLQKLIIPTAIVFACGMLYMYGSYNYNELKKSYAMATQEIVIIDNELQEITESCNKSIDHLLGRINDQQNIINVYNHNYDSLSFMINNLNSMNKYLKKTIDSSFEERYYNEKNTKRNDIETNINIKDEQSPNDSNTVNGTSN